MLATVICLAFLIMVTYYQVKDYMRFKAFCNEMNVMISEIKKARKRIEGYMN